MQRLLKISFDLALLSLIPVLSWFALGIIVDKNLINVFTLTYPIQFLFYAFKAMFATGANITKLKEDDKDAAMNGIFFGMIIGLVIFLLIVVFIDEYIMFMNMDVKMYKEFAIYFVIQLYIQLGFSFIIEKLYYENKNSLANQYSIGFNLLNFLVLIITSLITKNKFIIVLVTLLSITAYVIIIFIKNVDKFKMNFNILRFLKYDAVEFFDGILFLLIYLFGISNALKFGEEFALAMTFIALITDTQWDSFLSISISSQIDISGSGFNFKEHLKNAYKLLGIIIITIMSMFAGLYYFYDLKLLIVLSYLAFELISFALYPIYQIKTCFLQIEDSAIKPTVNKFISNSLRMAASFLNTPFCTAIGQLISGIYQSITINIMFFKKFKVLSDGTVVKKIYAK